jgi:putative transposase
MPRNVYSEINLHFVWHTKDNAPVLVGPVEASLHTFLRDRALQTPGLYFHDIGGVEDHVHLVVSVPPTLLISDWIGQMKGSSSHYINHRIANRHLLDWQTGYGVVSFGTGDLPWVISYVRNQKQHHAKGTIQERLERGEAEAGRPSPLKRAAGQEPPS